MDDLEFVGKKPSHCPFVPVAEIEFICQFLNKLAFNIYQNPYLKTGGPRGFLKELKEALVRLHERECRLELFGSDFWLVDKHMEEKYEHYNGEALLTIFTPEVLTNAP